MNLVNFNYDHFKAGRPVVTRDGRRAIYLKDTLHQDYPLTFSINESKRKFCRDGRYLKNHNSIFDLMHPADPKWDNPGATPADIPQDIIPFICTDSDIATIEMLHDKVLEFDKNFINTTLSQNSRSLTGRMYSYVTGKMDKTTSEDKEVWLRLYCALLVDRSSPTAAKLANEALAEYKKRWL